MSVMIRVAAADPVEGMQVSAHCVSAEQCWGSARDSKNPHQTRTRNQKESGRSSFCDSVSTRACG